MQALLISLTALLVLSSAPIQAQSKAEQSIIVERQTRPIEVELDAVIEAVDAATLAAQTSGRVLNLYYDVNDFVEKDAVILEITRTQQSAGYAAAEAQLKQATAKSIDAQRHWQRLAKLYPQGAVAQGQLDQAEANAKAAASAVKAAEAMLIQAKETLDYTVVKAPFSGVVTQRHIDRGETINVGQPLYSGYSLENMRAVANIPQRYLPMINSNTVFTLEQNGQMLQSQDYTLFSHADQQSHSFKIRLNLPNQAYQLYPGTWAKLSFSYGQRQQIWIPHSAVVQRNELSAVYRKTEQGFQLSQVRLGKVQGEQIQVLAGLEQGDEIALSAYQTLLNKE